MKDNKWENQYKNNILSLMPLKTKKEKNTAKRTGKKEVHHKKTKKERASERERQFY